MKQRFIATELNSKNELKRPKVFWYFFIGLVILAANLFFLNAAFPNEDDYPAENQAQPFPYPTQEDMENMPEPAEEAYVENADSYQQDQKPDNYDDDYQERREYQDAEPPQEGGFVPPYPAEGQMNEGEYYPPQQDQDQAGNYQPEDQYYE